ncbi:MAG TPA: hypothetical protein DD706_24420 [Nitrospiraceae bacterium]|nr:hypothetical protein [Nitrospiraceae bacterium]
MNRFNWGKSSSLISAFIFLATLTGYTDKLGVVPVSVGNSATTFLNRVCASFTPIYTVPVGKLLIIDDASAGAVSAAIPNAPDPNISVHLDLATTTDTSNRVDNLMVGGVGVPVEGGRTSFTTRKKIFSLLSSNSKAY